jgi:hypothetical protein
MTYRLLKVIVQAVLVKDDGESLTEVVTDPVMVSARDWPTYAENQFVKDLVSLNKGVHDDRK